MSKTFAASSTTQDGRVLIIEPWEDRTLSVAVSLTQRWNKGICIPNEDAPALALAILEAAGVVLHDPEDTPYDRMERTTNMGDVNVAAYYLFTHVTRAEKIAHIQAEEAAALEKLTSRRNELASEFSPPRSTAEYRNLSGTSQRAIDRIIELEDKAQS